jgi:tetratricopeptide (TPR) repeat protein
VTRARIHHLQGQFDLGEEHAAKAEEQSRRFDWSQILPAALKARAYGAQQRGDLTFSAALYLEAKALYEAQSSDEGTAGCLHGLGEVSRLRGQTDKAYDYNQQALALFERLGDPIGVADCLRGLGVVTQHRGDLAGAANLYRQAMAKYESVDNPYGVAVCVNDLAEAARWQGQLARAESGYRRALTIYENIGSRDNIITDLNLGLVLLTRERYDEAREVFIDGAKSCEEVGRLGFLGAVHTALLCCAAKAEDWTAYDDHFERAEQLLRSTALVDADIAWPARLAGDIARDTKQDARARKAYQLAKQQYEALNDQEQVNAIESTLATIAE